MRGERERGRERAGEGDSGSFAARRLKPLPRTVLAPLMFYKTPEREERSSSPSAIPFNLSGGRATQGDAAERKKKLNIYKRQSFVYIPDMNNCHECFIHAVLFVAFNLRRGGGGGGF